MRTVLFATVIITGMSFDARPVKAQEGPWCAIISLGTGAVYEDCQYRSLEECRPNVLAGNRGFCNPNPRWAGPSEDQNGRKKWAVIKKSIAAFDPALIAHDDKEEARIGNLDHRLNHWTAVRDALVSAHADLFQQIPAIVKTLPNPIDQMKLFELIQIIPTPTRSALKSGQLSQL